MHSLAGLGLTTWQTREELEAMRRCGCCLCCSWLRSLLCFASACGGSDADSTSTRAAPPRGGRRHPAAVRGVFGQQVLPDRTGGGVLRRRSGRRDSGAPQHGRVHLASRAARLVAPRRTGAEAAARDALLPRRKRPRCCARWCGGEPSSSTSSTPPAHVPRRRSCVQPSRVVKPTSIDSNPRSQVWRHPSPRCRRRE